MEYKSWIGKLSLREKAELLTGADAWHTAPVMRLGIPSIMMSDGPNGLRKRVQLGTFKSGTVKSVCYPSATALAASWDRNLLDEVGKTIASECKANRVSVLLGPGVNIKRSPLCGRNFEYYSEDPVLAGELAASYINAVQNEGIGTSLKHFAANNTETKRMASDSLVDERALREIYLKPFEIAVKKAQPWTVMCAYNKLNGVYCTENEKLINDILRNEWGFEGLAVSDWAAINNRTAALNAGLDLEMPGSGYVCVSELAKSYRDGSLSEDIINKSVKRVFDLVEKSENELSKPVQPISLEENHKLAVEMAENCAVLLKNEANTLPLSKGQSIAIIGERAKKPMYQGFGSACVNSYKVDNVLDSLSALDIPYVYSKGYRIEAENEIDPALINEACFAAANNSVAVVFVSCSEMDASEAADRDSLKLPAAHKELISAVCKANPNTVVVLTSGSVVEMPWVNEPKAIMQTYFLGEGAGMAIAKLLMGIVSPSGKLPETYPISMEDTPCPNNYKTDENGRVLYKESIYVGYRYYEKTGTPVLFPFGHGLTYTNFEYSNLNIDKTTITQDDVLKVSFDIKNIGSFTASEISQVYVGKKDSLVYRAPKELKEFTKVKIAPGEKSTVTVELSSDSFKYYSVELNDWALEDGEYDIYVGASSTDIKLVGKVLVKNGSDLSKELDYLYSAPKYFNGDIKNISDNDFEDIFRDNLDDYIDEFDDDRITAAECLSDAKKMPAGRMIDGALEMVLQKMFENDPIMGQIIYNSFMDIPIKRFEAGSFGICSKPMVDGIVHLINSKSLFQTAQIFAAGIPTTVINIAMPALKKAAEKKSRS